MKKNIYISLIISALLLIESSCSKKDATPQTCYLSNVNNAKGNTLEKLTYDGANRLISYGSDSTGLTFDLSYNAQNAVDKIVLTDKTAKKTIVFTTTFTYDPTGKAIKAVTTLNNVLFQTNTLYYSNGLLGGVRTVDSQNDGSSLRFEYNGNNIAKGYLQYDGEKEFLYYEITKFDDKKSNYPEGFKAIAMGLSGLFDEISYLNQNNTVSEKYYDDDGNVYYTNDNTYEYDSNLLPSKRTSTTLHDGRKSTSVGVFQYFCR